MKLNSYCVSFMCIYNEVVRAESAEEAVWLVESECPYDIDGKVFVTNLDTGEEFEEIDM